MAKPKPPWSAYLNYDIGELNPLSEDVFDSRYDNNQDIFTTYSEVLRERYSSDILTKTGPYLAIVLKVLSGPQVNNEASTNGGNLTKTISLNNFKDAQSEEKENANKPLPLKVIARIPEFDADIDFPEDEDDEARMAAHGEYHQMREDKTLEQVTPGSLIWVDLNGLDAKGQNGRPTGKIISLHDPGSFSQLDTFESSKDGFNPPCKALRNMAGPGGGIYIGHTESDPVLFMGPPIRKIKGRIKTGLFGNGTAQTKQHFDRCLQLSKISGKFNIAGSAPWSSQGAFVWVGHLRNNGYKDTFNRPDGLGRETIIYAPGSLDLSSPIEIKYYLHDRNGFGRAWSLGDETDMEAAINAADDTENNDFKDKIGPGIKDLIRQGRNFILVIPEMSYSYGYDSSRLVGREFLTFDGSITGGDFTHFHYEVVAVLERHFPGIDGGTGLNEYVSVLADGQGAIALAAVAKPPWSAGEELAAWQSFKGSPIKRIDFVDTGLDKMTSYSSYFTSMEGIIQSPSSVLYDGYIIDKPDVEFNYITEYTADTINYFFEKLEHGDIFRNNNKPNGGLGERKFSFPVLETVGSSISMHIATKDTSNVKGKVAYAFSMINDYNQVSALKKTDSDDTAFISFDSVPDHAEACSKSQAASDAAKIEKKMSMLAKQIEFFEGFLIKFLDPGSDYECADPDNEMYRIYCTTTGLLGMDLYEAVETNNSSRFFTDYVNYLMNKKTLAGLEEISKFEGQLMASSLYKDRLKDFKNNILAPARQEAKAEAAAMKEIWKSYLEKFDRNNITLNFINNATGLPAMAKIMAASDAYEKILLKVDNTIEKLSSRTTTLSPECAPPPLTLDAFDPSMLGVNNPEDAANMLGPESDTDGCSGKKIAVPSTFDEIYEMIPYTPEKKDFPMSGRSSKVSTGLDMINSYQIDTFNYQARGPGGQITNLESPPIWSCITNRVASAWSNACAASGYTPFSITQGIRGYEPYKGNTAYNYGMSLHAFGLAIDIDPFITGYSKGGSPLYSVYTGAWSSAFLARHGQELYDLGVFKTRPSTLLENAYQEFAMLRVAENWAGAPNSYKGGGESGGQRSKYKTIMNAAKGSPIVPPTANPTMWLITFCESSGMRWGNAKFLKKRWRGGSSWSESEKKKIAQIYGIPNIVNRIKAISWATTTVEDHMHFHFWTGKSLVSWAQIKKTKKRVG